MDLCEGDWEYFGGLNWASEGGEDEVKELFPQFRV